MALESVPTGISNYFLTLNAKYNFSDVQRR